jgi:hypothetical protein
MDRRQAGEPRRPNLAWWSRSEALPRPPSVFRPEQFPARPIRTYRLHPTVLVVREAEEGGSAPAAMRRRLTQRLPGTAAIARPVQVDGRLRAVVPRHPAVALIREGNVVDRIDPVRSKSRRSHVPPTAIVVNEQTDNGVGGRATLDRPVRDRIAKAGRYKPRRTNARSHDGHALHSLPRRRRYRAENAQDSRGQAHTERDKACHSPTLGPHPKSRNGSSNNSARHGPLTSHHFSEVVGRTARRTGRRARLLRTVLRAP